MAEFEGMAKALQIDSKILGDLDKVDKKIQSIANNSERMAKAFQSAMSGMSGNAGTLLERLTRINSVLNGLGNMNATGLNNVSSSMGRVATEGERVASSINNAATAVNRFGASGKNIAELKEAIQSINKQLYVDEGVRPACEQQRLVNIRKVYQEELKLQETSDQEKIRKEQEADTHAYNNWLKLKDQELKEEQRIEAEKAKVRAKNIQEHLKQLEELRKKQAQWASESAKAAGSGEEYQQNRRKIELMYAQMFDAIEKRERASNEKRLREQERAAREHQRILERQQREQQRMAEQQAKMDSRLRRSNYQSYVTSTEGSLRTAGRANTYAQRAQAIKNLEAAMKRLRTTDANYQQDLARLSAAHSKLVAEQRQVENGFRRMQESQSHMLNTSQQLQRQLALLFSVSAIEGYVNKLIQVRGEFELQNTALASILKNKDQADRLFGQITQLAVQSPFTVKELTTYTKSLAAYSVEYEDLYGTLKMLADVSAGLGVDMQRLILAFGQVKAANYLRGTETRQFTEAGVNMLGELAKYYTELEGRIVSVSEVQDRQFKRMIAFEDVAEVFKRLTSESGMFYQMQERQAETLAGLMSNLQDRIDLMLNSIGQDNDSALKGAIGLIGSLIDNYEMMARVIQAAGAAFVLFKLNALAASDSVKRLALNFGILNGSMPKTLTLTQLLHVGILRLGASLKAAGVALKGFFISNIPLIAITALVSAIYELIHWNDEYNEQLKQINDRHNEQVASLNKLTKAYRNLTKEAEEMPNITMDSDVFKEQLNSLQELYTMIEERGYKVPVKIEYITPKNINEAFAQGSALLQQGSEFGRALSEEIARGMTDTEGWFGIFGENLKSDLEDLGDAYSEVDGSFKRILDNIQNAFLASEKLPESAEKYVEELEKGKKENEDEYHWVMRRLSLLQSINKETNGYLGVISGYNSEFNDLLATAHEISIQEQEAGYELDKVFDRLIEKYGGLENLQKEYADNPIVIRTEIDQAFERLQLNAQAERFAKFWASQQLKIPFEWEERETSSSPEFYGDFRDSVKELDTTGVLRGALKDMHSMKDLEDAIIKAYKESSEELEVVQRSNTKRLNLTKQIENYKEKALSKDAEEAAYAREQVEMLTKQRSLVDSQNSASEKSLEERLKSLRNIAASFNLRYISPKQSNKAIKRETDELKEQISLIEKAQKQYQEYQKLYDEDTAQRMTENAFRDAFSDLGLNVEMSFEPSGVIEAFRKLMDSVGDEGDKLLNEKIAIQTTNVTTKQREKEVEGYRKEIDKLFESYDNFRELEKLGLDKTIISQLFGINTSSISDIESVLDGMKAALRRYGKEGVDIIKSTEKKITDMQQEELNERLKEYAERLNKSVSERARIEIEAQKEIQRILATKELDDSQRNYLIQQTREKAEQKKSKASWDEFQNSSMYVKIFEDLGSVSSRVLTQIQDKLSELRSSLTNLPPEDLKTIIQQITSVEEELISRNPFKGIGENIKEYVAYARKAKDIEEAFVESSNKEEQLKKTLDTQQLIVNATNTEYSTAVKKNGADSIEAAFIRAKLELQKKTLDAVLAELVAQKKITEEYAKQLRDGEKQKKSLGDRFSEIGSWASQASTAVTDIAESMENVFGKMSDKTADIVNTLSETLAGVGNMASGVGRIMEGDIVGGSIQTLTGLASTIGSLFSIGDKKKERGIQRELELVEELERQYQKLEKAIDDAYSLDTYNEAYDNAVANIKQQQQSLQNAINAEQDKKNSDGDRIKEWQNQIDDLNQQLEELKEQVFSQYTGGIFDDLISAAEGFTNAWLEAFRETGKGIKGLEDNFQELLETMLVRQASMAIVSPMIKQMEEQLKNYVNENDAELTSSEAKEWIDSVTSLFPEMSQNLENFFNSMKAAGFNLEGEPESDSLTGLQKGIQGITEDTAEVLAAITESIRFYVGQIYTATESIRSWLFAPPTESPLYQEMIAQTEQLRLLYSLVNSTTKTKNGVSGRVVKVEIV